MLLLAWDKEQVRQFQDKRLQKALIKSVSQAGGDALRVMRTDSTRAVRERKKFKLKTVNGMLKLAFPKSRTNLADLSWALNVKGDQTPIKDLGARQTARGVTFAINQGKRSVIKGAFFATMKSGHSGVFYRLGKARLPIDEAFTTRVSDVFRDNGMIPQRFERASLVFRDSFMRLAKINLAKIKDK